ncbi:MAG: DUF3500 domain-containing protein [Myxococcales bacterium]|nr:DUF3500 domain-containing protein [Myxococcales bacterium]
MANTYFLPLGLLSFVLALTPRAGISQSSSPGAAHNMRKQASALLNTLSKAQKLEANPAFADHERFAWNFWPGSYPGIDIEKIPPKSKAAATKLIRTGLSQQGYTKAEIIRELDRFSPWTSPGPFLIIFGDPKGVNQPWGWRLQGHHLSFNFTIVGNEVVGVPSLMGTQPLSHPSIRNGTEPLEKELALAIKLFLSLKKEKQSQARIARPSMAYLPNRVKKVKRPKPGGIHGSQLNAEQRGLLQALIAEYVENLTPEIATKFHKRMTSEGTDPIVFGFAGTPQKGQPHYYRIQGPSFMIEYDNRDGGDHIHCVWRLFDGDFGEDLLKRHYTEHKH